MEFGRQRRAVAERQRGTGAQKKAVSRGRAKMNEAADKTLEKHSEEIAKSLYESLLGGNATCAKLLFALAEGQIDCEDEVAMERLCSLAEKLAKEPEWVGELDDAEMETILEESEQKG
jgi:hypothetical protein